MNTRYLRTPFSIPSPSPKALFLSPSPRQAIADSYKMPQTRNHVLSRLAKLVFLFPALISLTDALNPLENLNPTGQGCVDPTGFLECFKTQSDQAKTCLTNAENTCVGPHDDNIDSCAAGCTEHLLAANIGCWLQSCWNQASQPQQARALL